MDRRGNCYYASEALYHILGGKRAGWKPMRVVVRKGRETCGHWFLKHSSGLILDPARRQFRARAWFSLPDYTKARGTGFLTKKPSRDAQKLIRRLTWYSE